MGYAVNFQCKRLTLSRLPLGVRLCGDGFARICVKLRAKQQSKMMLQR
jgi:hypothetical protein